MLSAKKSLRQQYRATFKALEGSPILEHYHQQAYRLLGACIREQRPRRIGLYMAMKDEPNIDRLTHELCQEMQVYLPRVLDAEHMHFYRYYGPNHRLETDNAYAIREPEATPEHLIHPADLDLIVVPAMAFDSLGYRLGRGAGYYDRYLPQTSAVTYGISLPLLAVDHLPVQQWDVPMHHVIRLTPPAHDHNIIETNIDNRYEP